MQKKKFRDCAYGRHRRRRRRCPSYLSLSIPFLIIFIQIIVIVAIIVVVVVDAFPFFFIIFFSQKKKKKFSSIFNGISAIFLILFFRPFQSNDFIIII